MNEFFHLNVSKRHISLSLKINSCDLKKKILHFNLENVYTTGKCKEGINISQILASQGKP